MEITEVDALGDNHDDHLQDNDDATPVVTPSQGPPTQTTINSLTIANITAGPVQPQPSASFSGE